MKRGKLVGNIVLILILVASASTIITGFVMSRHERELNSSPEQTTQAEVVSKRITKYSTGGHRMSEYKTYYTYIVAFTFPDGLIKEFQVDIKSVRGASETEPYSSLYDAFREGNAGILTFKEINDTEWRLFINFEKDPEYGGMKLEMNRPPNNTGILIILIGVIIFAAAFLIVLIIAIYKYKKNLKS